MAETANPLRIDIVSDVVCPWCILGWRQLDRALRATRTDAMIFWHPFELNPHMPKQGQNLREHIAEKYGSSAAESQAARDRLTALGEEVGFTFSWTDDKRIFNTFDAHQLLHWAGEEGRAHTLKQALFAAYFTDGRDVSDGDTLTELAVASGLDASEARAVLEDGRFAKTVRERETFWTSRGVQGVPAVIFDAQHLVSGAQGVEGYTNILGQIAKMRAEEPVT